MSRLLKVPTGVFDIVLPNGLSYTGPIHVVLSDDEFSEITQAMLLESRVIDLGPAPEGYQVLSDRGMPSGYAPLNTLGKVPLENLAMPQGAPGAPGSPGQSGSPGPGGPPGPPGPTGSGSGGASYVHEQLIASAVWGPIGHGLGFKPSVSVLDSAGRLIEGDVQHLDSNTVTIFFASAFGGTAIFS